MRESTRQKLSEQKRGSRNPQWKGGRHGDGHGYIRVTVAPGKYVFEHRLVMERALGRKLKPSEHVHHRNGVTDDNRRSNLQVLNASEHHRLKRKFIICTIDGCGRQHRAKGLCGSHYNKKFRYGGYSRAHVVLP